MTCREVMTSDPVCCLPNESAIRVAKLMRTQDVGAVPVCEDRHTKKLLGIVTDRDLALKIIAEGRDPNSVKAEDAMTRTPIACRGDDDLQRAIEVMERNQVRRLPVVDEDRQLIGIISQADVATRTGQPGKTAELVQEISKTRIHEA